MSYNRENQQILFEEFKFYNKQNEVIDQKILDDLKTQCVNGQVFWTNKELADDKICIRMYKLNDDTYMELVIFEKSITVEDIEKTKDIYYDTIFYEELKPADIKAFTKIREQNQIHQLLKKQAYQNFKELAKEIMPKIRIHSRDFTDIQETVKACFDIELKKPVAKLIIESRRNSSTLNYISSVDEVMINGVINRVAVICETVSPYHYYDGNESPFEEYKLRIFPESDPEYNYIDKDTTFVEEQRCVNNQYKNIPYYFDKGLNLIVAADGVVQITCSDFDGMLRNLHDIIGDSRRIITKNIYTFYVSERNRISSGSRVDESMLLMIQKYQKLIKEGKEIRLNGLHITQNYIRTEDNQFTIEFEKDFIDMIEDFSELRDEINSPEILYNFNVLFENILKKSTLKIFSNRDFAARAYKEWNETNFKVNGIEIKITKADARVKINGIFCRIDDVFEILSKAICYNNKADFDLYVKDVSFIGTAYKKMIGTGITIILRNPLFRKFAYAKSDKQIEEMTLRFSLLWDTEKRSKIYLFLNGQKYLINDKTKFKKHFFKPQMYTSVAQLKTMLKECIEKFGEEEIISIIENAMAEAKIIKDRGVIFLNDTVKDIGAELTQFNIQGKEIKGYYFKGVITGAPFFVDMKDMSVYKQLNGQWNRRCVVDDPKKNRIFEDRLANRLANIYNENKNIKQIQN